MSEKILFVDDEPAALDGYRRTLRQEFAVSTAVGAEQGLQTLRTGGPFAVVISDMRMPGMNGAEFLAAVREKAPESVRMLLTGHADMDVAIQAVNQGNIFRFLTKPCEKGTLLEAINSGLTLYRAAAADKELVEHARKVEESISQLNAEDAAQMENYDGAAGLPGPAQAKSFLEKLVGTDHQTYAVLIKLTQFHTIEERHGDDAAADYISSTASHLVNAFRATDRFFQWTKDSLLAVVQRQMPSPAVRLEIMRLTASTPQQIVAVNGRKVMMAVTTATELVPLAQFTSLDEMLLALNAKITGVA